MLTTREPAARDRIASLIQTAKMNAVEPYVYLKVIPAQAREMEAVE